MSFVESLLESVSTEDFRLAVSRDSLSLDSNGYRIDVDGMPSNSKRFQIGTLPKGEIERVRDCSLNLVHQMPTDRADRMS